MAAPPLPVNLGTASSFTLLAGSTITSTGVTIINGDVGVNPGTAFDYGTPPAIVNGTVHLGDATAVTAKADLLVAFNDAASRATGQTIATELGGATLTPDVYDSAAGTFGITGTLTLDALGDPNACFIFKTASTLITAAGNSNVNLINGAQSANIYWKVGSSATLGTNTHFEGNILAQASITANTGSTVNGRLLALDGAVTVDSITGTNPLFPGNWGVTVAPVTYARSGRPGTTVNYYLTVTNTGDVTDTFKATVAGNAWPTPVPAPVGPLAAGASSAVRVTVTIPAGTLEGATDTALVTFTSTGDPSESATSTLTTTATGKFAFYFAEGYTGAGFQEYLCLGNAGDDPVTVDATFLFKDGSPAIDRTYTVPALSRFTADVNNEVGADKEVSIKCESSSPFIAERPMYFDYNGWTGGHDAVGATAPASTWYFAEGYTGAGFDEYICVLNDGDSTANLIFDFQTQEEGPVNKTGYSVGPHTRGTFKVNDILGPYFQTSLKLTSDVPVVAERPMYFDYLGPSGDKHWTGGHCVMGTPELFRLYYFAEGTTRSVFHEYLTLQNPGAAEITIDAVYQLGAGQGDNVAKQYTVGAGERSTIFVEDAVGTEKDVSVRLSSDSDFLAERPMYFDYDHAWTGGHCVIGSPVQDTRWFFAEGYTGDGFHEWLTIQNTGATEAHVRVTYYPETGAVIVKDHTVLAGTRYNIFVNADAGENLAISSELISDNPIIVERPMYFNFGGVWTGGSDVVGYIP